MMMSKMKEKKGFTLMEVIVVIAILAILASIAVPTISGYIEKANETNDLQVATNIVRHLQVGITNPANDVPKGKYFTVYWTADDYSKGSSIYNHLQVVTPAAGNSRVSTISQSGIPPVTDPAELEKIARSLYSTLGVNESDIKSYTPSWEKGWTAPLPSAKSEVATKARFYCHVNTTTGEVALAKSTGSNPAVGNPNLWIDIGVNATPAP